MKRCACLPKMWLCFSKIMNFWILPERWGKGFGRGIHRSWFPRRKVNGISLLSVLHETKSYRWEQDENERFKYIADLRGEWKLLECWRTEASVVVAMEEGAGEKGGEMERLSQCFWLMAHVFLQAAHWWEFIRTVPPFILPYVRTNFHPWCRPKGPEELPHTGYAIF